MIFLDSGFVIALNHVRDEHHSAATAEWDRLRRARAEIVTTSLVIVETVNFCVSRGRRDIAVDVARELLEDSGIHVIHVEPLLLWRGVEYLDRRRDKEYSLTDCVSFVVMESLEIIEALAFDAHFTQAGFVRLPLASA